ncbi:MAG TPA: hypothetical protein VE690_21930, partial [Rhodopila sp.]|nr:hypothetical protein [Rhodopila sp.]
NGDIAGVARLARAIDDRAAADDDIVHLSSSLPALPELSPKPPRDAKRAGRVDAASRPLHLS